MRIKKHRPELLGISTAIGLVLQMTFPEIPLWVGLPIIIGLASYGFYTWLSRAGDKSEAVGTLDAVPPDNRKGFFNEASNKGNQTFNDR